MKTKIKPKFKVGDKVVVNDQVDKTLRKHPRPGTEALIDLVDPKEKGYSYLIVFEKPKTWGWRYSDIHRGWWVPEEHLLPSQQNPKEPTAPMTKRVLEVLKKKGSLTALEAGGILKVRQMPYQIHALRKLGWKINSEFKRDPIDGQSYVRYHLVTVTE